METFCASRVAAPLMAGIVERTGLMAGAAEVVFPCVGNGGNTLGAGGAPPAGGSTLGADGRPPAGAAGSGGMAGRTCWIGGVSGAGGTGLTPAGSGGTEAGPVGETAGGIAGETAGAAGGAPRLGGGNRFPPLAGAGVGCISSMLGGGSMLGGIVALMG